MARSWNELIASTTARASDVQGMLNFLSGNIVPMSTGTLANNEFSLGTTSAKWLNLHADKISVSTGTSFFLGNVGIGTSNLSEKFTVSDSNPAIVILDTDGTGVSRIFFGDNSDINVGRFNYNHTNNSIDIYTNGRADTSTNPFHIDSDGNVGIGTATPAVPLEISAGNQTGNIGQLKVAGSGTEGGYIQVEDAGVKAWFMGVTDGDSGLHFRENGTTTDAAMYLQSGGNVGIGTTSPDAPLSIKEASNVFLSFIKSTDTTIYTIKEDGASGLVFNNGSDRLALDSAGNVGIGTASPMTNYPSTGLEIDQTIGGIAIDGSDYALLTLRDSGASSNTQIFDMKNDGGKTEFRAINDAYDSSLYSFLTMDHTNGNVGINTTTPSQTLDVNGNVAIDGTIQYTIQDVQINTETIDTLSLSSSFLECTATTSTANGIVQIVPEANGRIVYIKNQGSSGLTFRADTSTSNIDLNGDASLTLSGTNRGTLTLIFDGTKWIRLSSQ